MRVLLLEGEVDLADTVRDFLRARGWDIAITADPEVASVRAQQEGFDVLVFDVMLGAPIDGNEVCRRLRKIPSVRSPILMLTACDTLDDKLAGFDAGCDDYLPKPFALQELLARLKALAQRGDRRTSTLRVGDLQLDVGQHVVTRDGQTITLSGSAFRLLTVLMRASPDVVDRE